MNRIKKIRIYGFVITAMILLSACGVSTPSTDTDNDDSSDDNSIATEVILPTTFTLNDGRTLGSQCAQCHGTNGISTNKWDSIAGEDDLADEVFEHNDPIMDAQAKGYTVNEINEIGTWLSTIKGGDDD